MTQGNEQGGSDSGDPGIIGSGPITIDTNQVFVTISLDDVSTPSAQISAWTDSSSGGDSGGDGGGDGGGDPQVTADAESGGDSGGDDTILKTYSFIFLPLVDEGWSEDRSVNYTSADIPGRAEPFLTYAGGGSRTFSLPIQFYAFSETDGDYNLAEIEKQARWLDRLKEGFTDSSSNISYPPPPVIVQVGNIFVARAFLTGGTITRSGPMLPKTMQAYHIVYNAQFTVVRASSKWSGSFSSYTSNVPKAGQFLTF